MDLGFLICCPYLGSGRAGCVSLFPWFAWLPCPNCGRFYLDCSPGCGLKLAMAGLLVVMLGRPVCGVLVLMGLYRADAPFPMF